MAVTDENTCFKVRSAEENGYRLTTKFKTF